MVTATPTAGKVNFVAMMSEEAAPTTAGRAVAKVTGATKKKTPALPVRKTVLKVCVCAWIVTIGKGRVLRLFVSHSNCAY